MDQIVCPDNMREPMYAEMGERPEFLGRTVEEVMRAYASGIAVVGTTRQRDGLKFPNHPDERMKERLREEGQVPIIQQREVMPSRGFRVVQSRAVEPGAPRTSTASHGAEHEPGHGSTERDLPGGRLENPPVSIHTGVREERTREGQDHRSV